MSILFSRYRNSHRPAPVQGTVVARGKNADYFALTQLRIMALHVNMQHLSHDSVSQYNVISPSSSSAIIQIPIDRRLI